MAGQVSIATEDQSRAKTGRPYPFGGGHRPESYWRALQWDMSSDTLRERHGRLSARLCDSAPSLQYTTKPEAR